MGIMLSFNWYLMKDFMSMSYQQHVDEEKTAYSGSYSIRAIVDRLDENDKVEKSSVCTHACIFDLKAGRDIIKSKMKNSKSDGFPFIEDEDLEKALSIAHVKYAKNLKD